MPLISSRNRRLQHANQYAHVRPRVSTGASLRTMRLDGPTTTNTSGEEQQQQRRRRSSIARPSEDAIVASFSQLMGGTTTTRGGHLLDPGARESLDDPEQRRSSSSSSARLRGETARRSRKTTSLTSTFVGGGENAVLATREFGRPFTARHHLSHAELRRRELRAALAALLAEYRSVAAIPNAELATIAALHDASGEDIAEGLDAVAFMHDRYVDSRRRLRELSAAAASGGGGGGAAGRDFSPIEFRRALLERRLRYTPAPPPPPPPPVAVASDGFSAAPAAGASPPATARSKVREYIRQRSAGAALSAAKEQVVNLRRVLNEIHLKMPALRRLQEQRSATEADADTEAGQIAAFGDVFTLLDEDGSGAVDLGEFLAFGRRVGGESAKVFSRALFKKIDSGGTGEVDRDGFIAVLFPAFVKRQQQQQQQREAAAAAAAVREEAAAAVGAFGNASWEAAWLPDELEVMKQMWSRCDAQDAGRITCDDLERVSRLDWPEARRMLRQQFERADSDGDGFIDFTELCAMMKPGLDAQRNVKPQQTKLFFQHVKAGW